MAKAVSHIVTRPGRAHGDPDVKIPVAEDLVTEPGNPVCEEDLSYYGREHPIEAHFIENSADREWLWTVYTPEFAEWRRRHEERERPLAEAGEVSGDIEPTSEPQPGIDVTESIRTKARELGFGETGFTRYDRRYTYTSRKRWVRFTHAICLALEQDYAATQTLPSEESEHAHFGTYEMEEAYCLELADHIRSLGYHAQIHGHSDSSAPYIPLFVSAGLGQLGANGQLLSPHFGSRARLMVITTDAPVTHDEPIDYGINQFCEKCQVCVNRCPSSALAKDKVWWRGAKKNKVSYKRCRPIMGRYDGCAICMKTCPVQRYGMQPVMEHYVVTGEVLGKGTHNLEGYTLKDKGYFGPKEKPHFDKGFFDIPRGKEEDWLFEKFKERMAKEGAPPDGEAVDFANEVKEALDKSHSKVGPVEP